MTNFQSQNLQQSASTPEIDSTCPSENLVFSKGIAKTPAVARKDLADSIEQTLNGRKTGWNIEDSARTALSILSMYKDEEGNPIEASEEIKERIYAAFNAEALQLKVISELASTFCDLDATTTEQIKLLLRPEELRARLHKKNMLQRETKARRPTLSDLADFA